MKSENRYYEAQHLFVLDASGLLDLPASKIALAKLASNPEFDSSCEVLMDLRDLRCGLTTNDIFNLADALAWPNPALPTHRKIAIVVTGQEEFDHASFLELCARNRGVVLAAFDAYEAAGAWLAATIPVDSKSSEDGCFSAAH